MRVKAFKLLQLKKPCHILKWFHWAFFVSHLCRWESLNWYQSALKLALFCSYRRVGGKIRSFSSTIYFVLLSLLLTLTIFLILFSCLYCWLWVHKWQISCYLMRELFLWIVWLNSCSESANAILANFDNILTYFGSPCHNILGIYCV